MFSLPWRLVLLSTFLTAVTAAIVAAFTPETVERVTVSQVLTILPTRRLVRLEGTVRERAPNRLTLSDSTGELRLATCPDWYCRLTFGAREKVRVLGHVAPGRDWSGNRPTFLVYQIQGDYGTRVVLRQNDGLPLWHRFRSVPGQRLTWENQQASADVN